MDEIVVKQIKNFPLAEFEVTVKSTQTTHHKVILDEDYYKHLTDEKISPEELIGKSFEFLLAREPNTSILRNFVLSDIADYFSEFPKVLRL